MVTQFPVPITHTACDQCQVYVHLNELKTRLLYPYYRLDFQILEENVSDEELTLNFGAVLSFLLRITQRTPLKETRMKWWVRSRMVSTERMQSQNLEKNVKVRLREK